MTQGDTAIDPAIWLDEHGDYLYSFVLMRVRDEATAEDLVQETLLSAFQSLGSYKGKSSEKTWLTSILKYKIIDYYRKKGREMNLKIDESQLDRLFEREDQWNGHWNKALAPKRWHATPESVYENSEFRMVLTTCLMKLPERTAATFTLSQIDGLSCEEIGEILDVTTNNCWVLLHRARLNLRSCIEKKWFAQPDG